MSDDIRILNLTGACMVVTSLIMLFGAPSRSEGWMLGVVGVAILVGQHWREERAQARAEQRD